MKSVFRNLLFGFIFCSCVFGQNSADSTDLNELKKLHTKNENLNSSIKQLIERQNEIVTELSKIGQKDQAAAKRLGAEVERLFPCCPFEDEEDEIFGMASGYTFRTEKTADGYFAVSFSYGDDEFEFNEGFSDGGGNHGFIINIGKIPLENVNEKLSQFAALAKYQPPFEFKDVKKEFVSGKFTFQNKAAVKIGDTYLLRAISYASDGNIDSLYALKVERRDADESIIVFIKKLKDFPLPQYNKETKYELSDIVEAGKIIKLTSLLREQGFNEIRLEFVERDLIVKGFVPTGKSAEVIDFLKKLNSTTEIKNELVEK